MELGNFFKILSRHKLTLIIIPLLTIIITFFLVRNQPDTYSSETQIATGLVDQTQTLTTTNSGSPQSEINQDFDNLTQIIRSKKMLDQVSYQLMIHDLTSTEPFEKPSKLFLTLNTPARVHALAVYTDYYNNRKELSLYNPDQNGLHALLASMGYDSESLLKSLTVYRAENSDFINIDYSADDPHMAAFVVNTLAREFITYYTYIVKENQRKAITFLGNLVITKKDTLDSKINQLKNYKIANQILNINEEARAIYTQIADYETHLEQAQRDEVSTAAAIRNIDSKFNPDNRKYMESLLVPVNQNIVSVTDQINSLLANNSDNSNDDKIDSLKRVVVEQISQSSDKYVTSPLAAQQNLVEERLTLEVQYQIAKNSIGTIQQGLVKLNTKLNGVVPHEAVVEQDESAIDIASKEYMDILGKYNQTSLDANYTAQLKQLETGMPGVAQPSKKMLLVILSGFITFIGCVIIFFLLYFFDDTIKTPSELANASGAPVLGYLNLLSSNTIDLRKVWTETNVDPETYQFKNLLQSIRFEVDTELAGSKILLINSLGNGEGKTFVATNLAYAYSLVNKKVLLIDGNFHNPGITHSVKSKLFVEDYLNGTSPDFIAQNSSRITVLSNKGGDGSLFEVTNENTIRDRFEKIREAFDVIIIEASSLNTLNKSKEWNKFADKILAVFEAGKPIRNTQKANLAYLKSQNDKFIGWVLNVVNKLDTTEEETDAA